MDRIYAAHISEDDRIQSIIDHLEETASQARKYASRFNNGEAAFLCGLFHDVGKYSEKFQKRIYKLSSEKVDHSTAGAKELNNRFGKFGKLLAYCVAGHHTGLPDGGSLADTEDKPTLCGRLYRVVEKYPQLESDFKSVSLSLKYELLFLNNPGFTISFYIRMLFSCLVDADYLDTEAFMNNAFRSSDCDEMDVLEQKVNEKISELQNPKKEIDIIRTQILNNCIEKSFLKRGLYSLTVPTGGGKTLSSLAFAIKHAKQNKMDRIIYVIPYNSIIEQNASVFKEILGNKNVLEHHSSINYDTDDDAMKPWRLATENWDMPVIVTTTVQFFESLFANKSSKCRKLHNMANSVIIFDEAQLLPTKYLEPCVQAISELVYNYKCSAVLCSATQPALGSFFPKELHCAELCESGQDAFRFFKRTNLVFLGEVNDTDLAERLNSEKQALCIVSTRKQAQILFSLLKKEGAFHLSTFMYPKHRKEVLAEIREKLRQGEPCRVISTSLVEAGVDLDFPVVYRAEAGLDSLIQAAGRCNREGKNSVSSVYVFKPEQQYRKSLPAIMKRPIQVMNSVASRYENISSPQAIQAYFTELYRSEGEGLDAKSIVNRLNDGYEQDMSFPFAAVAKDCKLIDENTRPIIIPYDDEAKALVKGLSDGERNRNLLRSVQQYTVNIYDRNYEALFGTGSIQLLDDQLAVLVDMDKYNEMTGLDVSSDIGQFVSV